MEIFVYWLFKLCTVNLTHLDEYVTVIGILAGKWKGEEEPLNQIIWHVVQTTSIILHFCLKNNDEF